MRRKCSCTVGLWIWLSSDWCSQERLLGGVNCAAVAWMRRWAAGWREVHRRQKGPWLHNEAGVVLVQEHPRGKCQLQVGGRQGAPEGSRRLMYSPPCTIWWDRTQPTGATFIPATTWMNLEKIMLSEKKPVTKDQILWDSIYMKSPEVANPQRWKADEWLQRDVE